jgi:uncharacterized protein YecE (DUF72 family)
MGRVAGRLFLGTSGFAYPEWKGELYPPDIRADAMLGYYASRFSSVEINYTFAREPSGKVLAKWTADTAEDFSFSLKAHRRITHERRLGPDAAEPLDVFLRSVEPLGGRTGSVLIQCPPNLKSDVPRLRDFLALLPTDRRFAFEFRHETWRDDAVKQLLAERGAAWCVADTDGHDAPFDRTAPGFVYLRLRKCSYEDEVLVRWAKDIALALDDGIDVYCYLKHEDGDGARGVLYAGRLREMLATG